MPVIRHDNIMGIANRLHLQMHHFARGTYPEADGSAVALPVNRFFMPAENRDGGYCYVNDGSTHLELRPGCAYFIPCFHKASMKLSPGLHFLSIHFSLEFYAGTDIFSGLHSIQEFHCPFWQEQAEKAFHAENRFTGAVILREVTLNFAAAVLSTIREEELEISGLRAEFRKELDYIQKNCIASTTVDELADIHGIRREVFSRKFTQAFGISPKQFLTRALVNRACYLLRCDHSAREVAMLLKFTSEYYFSRFFKKHIGIPPHKFSQIRL